MNANRGYAMAWMRAHGALGGLALGSMLLAVGACAGETDAGEQVAEASAPLFLFQGRNWTANTNYIPMCWTTPGYAAEKKAMVEAIGRTWVAEADLRVTWTDVCPTTGSALFVKVQIGQHGQVQDANGNWYWDHSTDGQTRGLGMEALSAPTTTPPDVFGTRGVTIWVEPNGGSLLWRSRFEYAAVHEMGHVLGFLHEQNRPEQEARACDPNASSGTPIGPYDRESIMNYCNSAGNASGLLSPGDKSGVRQVYGARKPYRQWGTAGDIAISGDFDGDRKKDEVIFRPSQGAWWIVDSSTHLERGIGWGVATDIPVAGDYDGDRKTDVAVWRPSTGQWWVIRSSDGTYFATQWGVSTDIPAPGDYDGDGRTDLAVYRPSEGRWYIVRSSTGAYYTADWGVAGDKVVPADYDGDGKTDLAIYRPWEGRWYIVRSHDGYGYWVGWGVATDKLAPADYDGDGKADVAVYRPSEGRWYVVRSRDNSTYWVGWGDPNDTPIAGDFDGDGRADICVWRPANGTWYATGVAGL